MASRPLPPGVRPSRRVDLANRLNSAAIHLLRRVAQDDGADGVTGARLSALSVIVYGGPMTTGDLARREGVALPTITRIVDALVRDGLARRTRAPGDRRVVNVEATPAGRRLMERGRSRRIVRLAAELDALDDGELEVLEQAIAVLLRLETSTAEDASRGPAPHSNPTPPDRRTRRPAGDAR